MNKKEDKQPSQQGLEQLAKSMGIDLKGKNPLDELFRQEVLDKMRVLIKFIPEDYSPDNPKNIYLTTEYPNANYTKQITKFKTWVSHNKLALGWDDNMVRDMVFFFAESMISHRRGREKNILDTLKDAGQQLFTDGKSRTRKLFG